MRTPLGAAAPAAFWSALVGLAAVTVLVVIAWAAAPEAGTPPSAALASGGQAWLLIQGGDLQLAQGSLTLVPWGLLLLPAYVLVRSGRWAARAADVRSWGDAARTTGLLAFAYALIGLGVALASVTPAVRPDPWSAVAGTALVACVAGGWGVLAGSGLRESITSALPASAITVVRGAAGALAVLVGGGALMVAASLAWHGGQVDELWTALGTDPVGAVLLLLLCVALLPNAVLWAAAYAVGPGFAVGAGTSVAPTGVVIGAVPAVPLLGALPGAGDAAGASLIALLLPVLAGATAGILVARRRSDASPDPALLAGLAAGAGAGAGIGLGVLASWSSGSLGAGRMVDLGPSGVPVGLVAALEMAVVAAAVAWEWSRLSKRRTAQT